MKQEGSANKLELMSALLLLAGLALLAFPYVQSAYEQWEYPITKIQSSNQTKSAPVVTTQTPSPAAQAKTFLPISGRLVIPSLNLDLQVGYGVGEDDLKKGPGFYSQSGYPSTGNVSIAGHRNAYGSPFMYLNELKPGDKIELYYDNEHYIYSVDTVYVTNSRDWSVVDPTSKPAITLTTCTPLHPINGHYDRLIVRGYLQESKKQ